MLWVADRICFKIIGYLYRKFGRNILSGGNLDSVGDSHFNLQQDRQKSDAECSDLLPGNAVYILPDRGIEPWGIFDQLHNRMDGVRAVFALFCFSRMARERTRSFPENCEYRYNRGFRSVINFTVRQIADI